MSRIACPHCSQPIENDPSLAGTEATCPYCDEEFQFPEVAEEPEKKAPVATASRRSPPTKTKAPATPKSDTKKKPSDKSKPTGKQTPTGKTKPTGKEKPAGMDLKLLGAKIGIVAVVIIASLYFFIFRKRDYEPERRAVMSYISSKMTDSKFDSWHGEGQAKGCTTATGAKFPDDAVAVRAFVAKGKKGKPKYKEDKVFIVVNGRVTNEIDFHDFRSAGKAK